MAADAASMVIVVGTYESATVCLSFNPNAPDQNVGLQKICQCTDHSGSVRAVATQRQWLATGSSDETIRLYDLSNFSEIGSLLKHEGAVTCVEFRSDCMLTAGEDGAIFVWKTGTWNCTATLTGHKGPVSCVAVHPTGKLTLSVGRDRVLRTWNMSTGYLVFRQKLKEVAQLVKWSSSAQQYAIGYTTTIEVYTTESGAMMSNIDTHYKITSFLFVREDVIAVASENPAVQMFSISSGECSAKLKGHTHRVKDLATDPHCNFLFSASSDGSIRAWRLCQPLSASVCMSVYETGYRLSCIALACPPLTKPTQSSAGTKQSGSKSTDALSLLAQETCFKPSQRHRRLTKSGKRGRKLTKLSKRCRSRSRLPFTRQILFKNQQYSHITKRKRKRSTH